MNPLRREERRAQPRRGGPASLQLGRWEDVNKELWLLLSMFAIAALVNFLVAANRVVLTLYFIPTLFAACYYGRRGSGADFDPHVVKAFVTAFSRGDLEVPEIEI